jgi:hypothetical protein
MLEVALLLEDIIEEYFITFGEDEIKLDQLNTEEWSILREIKNFLAILKSTTKSLKGHQQGLDKVIPSMDFILAQFEKAKIKYMEDDVLKNMVNSGWQKMEKYYSKTDESPAYAAAIILHPTRKIECIDQFWRPSWHEKAKNAVRKLWEDEYKPKDTLNAVTSTPQRTTKEFELWIDAIDTPVFEDDEYDPYIKAERAYGFDRPITWWLQDSQQKAYPNLSRMALDILSIPAMSSDPERAFSAAKITLTDRRNKLSIEMIECLECLKSWVGQVEWEQDKDEFYRIKEDVLIGPEIVEEEGEAIETIDWVRSTLYASIYGLQSISIALKLTLVRLVTSILQYVLVRAYWSI